MYTSTIRRWYYSILHPYFYSTTKKPTRSHIQTFHFPLRCSVLLQHRSYGLPQYPQILSEVPVLDIFAVQLHDFIEIRDAAPSADLPHSGDARLHGESGTVSEFVLFYLGDKGWSGAHEGDITFEHIKELRELVNTPVSDEVADSFFIGTIRQDPAANDTGIIIHLEHLAIRHFILFHELCLTFLRIHIHAAEFIEAELFAILAHPDLGENIGPGDWI